MSAGSFAVDLSSCDREPIHLLGGIQPFAMMLVLSDDWLIARASANVGQFLGREPDELIGRAVLDVLAPEAVHAIRNRLTTLRGNDASERIFHIRLTAAGPRFDVAVHVAGGYVVVEAEPSQGKGDGSAGVVRGMMSRLDQAGDLPAFFREAARQVRALTGFDRVMVYRFDDTGAGEVVAEATRSGIGSFMGLRYPASDIPAQARLLYVRNLFRIIADVGAPVVPLVPELAQRVAPVDLSLAVSRAVSPIHIEYLKNMGVAASLSISIVIHGKLWGLFACHHNSPRLPSLERRAMSELFSQIFSMKLDGRLQQEANDYLARAQALSERILATMAGDTGLLANPSFLAETLETVIPSDGVGVSINGRMSISGIGPDEAELSRLVRALNSTAASKVYATDRIADLLPEAEAYQDRAAGMLALPISRSPRDYVILFRQELVRTVKWGGDPHKPVTLGTHGARLTPRKSFEVWSELVSGRSQPFNPAEIRIAETLRATLIEVVLRISDETHAERQRSAEKQELLIAELNHRVRNILALIRGLVRQSRSSAKSVESYVREVDGRIHALARAHDQITAEHWGPGSLRTLIEAEARAYLSGRSDRIVTEGPDALLKPDAFTSMALVLHELVTNSAKYGGLSDSGRVIVSWHLDEEGDLKIAWREHDGPPVQAPTRQGFGSTIIQRSVPYDLGGKAEVRYLLTGVEADFCIPARYVVMGSETAAEAPPSHDRSGSALSVAAQAASSPAAARDLPLAGQTVLLVEDSLIIAMDAEDILTALGAAKVVPAANVRQALDELDHERPTIAVLDIHLGDQTSLSVAARLQAMGVTFLFATGYGDQAQLPAEMTDVPVLQKPYTREGVARVMSALVAR